MARRVGRSQDDRRRDAVLTPLGMITQNLKLLKQVNRRSWKSRMKGIFAQLAS